MDKGNRGIMTIETKFELKDKVSIIELNIVGTVMAFYYSTEIEYKIRYFDSGDPRELFFYESELCKIAKTI